jgi:hypothetical protein
MSHVDDDGYVDEPLSRREAEAQVDERLEDLGDVDTSKPTPWTVPGMVHEGARALMMGATGEGKSLAALVLALDVSLQGPERDVYWFDAEVGRVKTAKRVQSIMADRPSVDIERRSYFSYSRSFDFSDLDQPAVMAEWQLRLGTAALVVVDGMAKYLHRLGLDENVAAHVTRFMGYIDRLVENERTSVLICDNTGWSGQRSRGSSAKLDQVDTTYIVAGGQTCAVDKRGTIKLRNTKHRDGDEEPTLAIEAGDGTYTSIWADTRDAELLKQVRELLTSTPKGKNVIFALCKDAKVPVRRSVLLALLNQWAEDPYSGVYESPDGGFALDA